ncbi:Hypothetical_protein [Hexamita inflata]|uniref:Hypothetical_protein n=1 Tax=Hexamita inflata TaxID=28002 RepID=A0AA86P793_9EUKA|nr:Hypothetical protein HINF_LOCUS20766 [Hexamita inflata]
MKRRTAFGHRRALDTAVSLLYHLSPTARARRYSKDLLPWLSRERERNFWKLTILVVCTLITHYYDLSYINVLKASIWVPSRILSVCGLDIFTIRNIQAATPKQQIIFGVQVVYRSGLLDVMKRRTAFGHRRALDTAVSLLYHLSPTARARRNSRGLLPWLSESQKDISGNQQYQQFTL